MNWKYSVYSKLEVTTKVPLMNFSLSWVCTIPIEAMRVTEGKYNPQNTFRLY